MEYIGRAFDGALELISHLKGKMQGTRTYYGSVHGVPDRATKSKADGWDPAFVQYFKNDYRITTLDEVYNTFLRAESIAVSPGRGSRPAGKAGAVRIYCRSSYASGCRFAGTYAVTTHISDTDPGRECVSSCFTLSLSTANPCKASSSRFAMLSSAFLVSESGKSGSVYHIKRS